LSKADRLEKKKNLIMARFGWSRRWRAPWDTKWLRWYRMYRGSVPELPEWEQDRSNLHIPYTYSTVDNQEPPVKCSIRKPSLDFICSQG
jgi:hypothetical protein